jgi:hypothetical protein
MTSANVERCCNCERSAEVLRRVSVTVVVISVIGMQKTPPKPK